jgi:hypothetical protein
MGARGLLAAGALLLGATRVEAQAVPPTGSAAADTIVASTVERARARGLPVEPLINKVREGTLRRVPPARVRAAVTALADRLEVAQAALAPSPTPPEIAAGAEALSAGASPDVLKRVRSAGGDQLLVVPLGVLAQLVNTGVPVDRATALVVELVGRRTPPAQLIALSTSIEGDVKDGIAPNSALDVRLRGVRSTLQNPGGVTNTDVRATGQGGVGPTSAPRPPRKP